MADSEVVVGLVNPDNEPVAENTEAENLDAPVVEVEDVCETIKDKDCKLTFHTWLSAIHIRLYCEQFGGQSDWSHDEQAKFLHDKTKVNKNKRYDDFLIDIRVHDKDYSNDDFENPSLLKPHAHIVIVSLLKKKDGSVRDYRYQQVIGVLKKRLGVQYREEDASLWEHQIKLNLKNPTEVPTIIAYQGHNTFDAVKDGKYRYGYIDMDKHRYSSHPDISRNYERWYQANADYLRKKGNILSSKELALSLYGEALDLGRTGGDYATWYRSQSMLARHDFAKDMARGYQEGAEEWLEAHSQESFLHTRCCIFINGDTRIGKTTNSLLALDELTGKVLDIRGGKTGKFDNLNTAHKAMVISDTGASDYHALLDDGYSFLYRRNEGNPLNCTDYVVITFNGTMSQYMMAYAHEFWDALTDEGRKALLARCYHCDCDETGLHLRSCPVGGDVDRQNKRNSLFKSFYECFNRHQQGYIARRSNVQPSDKSADTLFVESLLLPSRVPSPVDDTSVVVDEKVVVYSSHPDYEHCPLTVFARPVSCDKCNYYQSGKCEAATGSYVKRTVRKASPRAVVNS